MKRILVFVVCAAGLMVLGGMNGANTAATAADEVVSVEVNGTTCDLTSCEPCPIPCPLPCSVAMVAEEGLIAEAQAD